MGKLEEVNNCIAHQTMSVITDSTIRGIVKTVNEEKIGKENIVCLLKEGGQFILVYFK